MNERNEPENQVRAVLEAWAKATRQNRKDDVLKNHATDLVIFDVLPPMEYESAAAYRRSWGDWQPEVGSEGQFDLENLTAQNSHSFQHPCIVGVTRRLH